MSNAKITPTFNELIDLSLYPESMGSYEVDIPLKIENETWTAYEANLAFREILFFTDLGTVTFLVDNINGKNIASLYDWEKDDDTSKHKRS